MGQVRIPLPGERVPRFEVQTARGVIRLPDDCRGRWAALLSHPADLAPVCTTEFVAFQKKCQVVG